MKSVQIFGSNFEERIQRAIDDLKSGKGILVVDDENRENEGDLIYPGKTMTVADMALMIRECSGIVCLCLTPEKCDELGLYPMVTDNTSKNKTAFTISIEAKEGVTTGVSAADRIQTIRTAVAVQAKAGDLAHPGHVFPLKARKNGVLDRPGHTEGSIDIVRLAGMGDSAVLCELTNPDGSMAKLPEIVDFAEKHQLTVITIEDIIQFRKISGPKKA
jgi:3,4-dihydroxy 2-butanone 4-phosphate synthase